MTIRIGIAEDVPRLAEALRQKVELDPAFSVVWLAPNGAEVLHCLKTQTVDLVLMDIRMPVMDGIAATEVVAAEFPEVPVVMATVLDDSDHILSAILAGARGYLLKDIPPRQIHQAIREALDGGAPMSPLIATKALALIRRNQETPQVRLPDGCQLTTREKEIVELLAGGRTYQQIADVLFISYGTVRKHIENIYRKLEVHNKFDAIRKVKDGN